MELETQHPAPILAAADGETGALSLAWGSRSHLLWYREGQRGELLAQGHPARSFHRGQT